MESSTRQRLARVAIATVAVAVAATTIASATTALDLSLPGAANRLTGTQWRTAGYDPGVREPSKSIWSAATRAMCSAR